MSQANYSPLIVSLFLDNPDCYNRSVLVLLKRLQTKLPTEEFQATVQSARNHLRGVHEDFDREFELLLMENNIGECLTGLTRLDPVRAASYLKLLRINDYPKQKSGEPDCGMDFWDWFEELPKETQKQVWDNAAEMPYG